MRITRFITVTALYTAILIAVQFALSWVANIELVTVFFLAFCYTQGAKAGSVVAVCFSTLRCFVFGFYPTVLILYLIYYTGFACFFGFLGNRFKKELSVTSFVWTLATATVFTALFTLIDDVITPLYFGFGADATIAYFYSSLPFMLTQCICAVISISVLFFPLCKAIIIAIPVKNQSGTAVKGKPDKE